jgi:low temperature requirement protein LtrA
VALWWACFDVVAPVAERVLRSRSGDERARLGRDSYTYLHFPMVAGIVYLPVGLKRERTVGSVNRPHAVARAVLLLAPPAVGPLPALAQLAVLTGVLVVLIAFEVVHYAGARAAVRARARPGVSPPGAGRCCAPALPGRVVPGGAGGA